MDEQCSRCRFWKMLREDAEGHLDDRGYEITDNGQGICRRYPPIGRRPDVPLDPTAKVFSQSASDAAMAAFWPVVLDEDWCGEFQPRLALV